MKDIIKKLFPHIHSLYVSIKIKIIIRLKIIHYKNLQESMYEDELKKLYKNAIGRELNINNPKSFTEKIQWRKLNELTPEMSRLSDKYAVREWIKEKIGESYLIPLLGVWDSPEKINFQSLPESYVLKTNNASGTVIIVKDKTQLNIKKTIRQLNYWLKIPFGLIGGLELQYNNIPPKIIAEKNMMGFGMDDLPDYKFFCFNGKVYCSYVMENYTLHHEYGKLGFFDRDFKLLNAYREDYSPITVQLEKPKNYDKMVEIAEILSEGFSHVRVDLYNIDGKIYFGEMTFTTNSGFTKFIPSSFDYMLGKKWILPK